MKDVIEQYPADKKRIKGDDALRSDLSASGADNALKIERFPAEKQQIRLEDPPELIFFDVDEDSEEADFVRVDDLFRSENYIEAGEPFFLTLFPHCSERILSGRISRVIRRTLYLSALRLNCSVSRVRVRPHFAQWLAESGGTAEPETLAREFRTDLEFQMNNLLGLPSGERFWSDNCFIWIGDTQFDDEKINGMIELYREK